MRVTTKMIDKSLKKAGLYAPKKKQPERTNKKEDSKKTLLDSLKAASSKSSLSKSGKAKYDLQASSVLLDGLTNGYMPNGKYSGNYAAGRYNFWG